MKRSPRLTLGVVGLAAVLLSQAGLAQQEEAGRTSSRTPSEPLPPLTVEQQTQVVGRYCQRCHNERLLRGGLSLEGFDVGRAHENAEVAEKMIRKLQAGMMPPAGTRRPSEAVLDDLLEGLVHEIDAHAATLPAASGRTFQRLNRAEYERAVFDLLGIAVDADEFLPADTVSAGFDNIADTQRLSTTVMEGYLSAANEISRLAVGDPHATPDEVKYSVSRYATQWDRVEGAPMGTRGGTSVEHVFPADGEYVFTLAFFDSPIANLYGNTTFHDEQIEISIDGERVALLDVDRFMDADNENLKTAPIVVHAGARRLTAAFLRKFEGPVPDLLSPHDWSLADRTIGAGYGVTTLPHLRDLVVSGPYNATGISATPSRQRIFSCRPTRPDEELVCAREIVSRLAGAAYRRPLEARDVEGLMSFYAQGAQAGGFEAGVRAALEAILVSPHFVFRFERRAGAPDAPDATVARLNDLSLASRLSFFLWATSPDAELVELAGSGRLSEPEVLAGQVDRMLADPRAEALAPRFAGQWLRLQDLDKVHPDSLLFPDYHEQLAHSMRRETELLFHHLVQEDRNFLELLTADYTFVDERLARHYGMPGIVGDRFQRVPVTAEERRGILGHASILTLTSHADRTSPVLRGKWLMVVLLGSPPPPPPPNVPELDATDETRAGRVLTVRERLEEHRANPACASCHRVIDPLGLALEGFDTTGVWRTKDGGTPIDASGELYDGSPLTGPSDLRRALLQYSDAIVTNFTENLLAYALGRRIDYRDMPAVRAIVREASSQDLRMRAFIHGVVASDLFRTNDQALGPGPRAAAESGGGG